MKDNDFEEVDDKQFLELVGECVAYMDTGSGDRWARVEYKIKYYPTGQFEDLRTPELMSQSLGEGSLVTLIGDKTCKRKALETLSKTSAMIEENGLYLGEWPSYDLNYPFYLFDQGGRIVGLQEDDIEI